MAGFRLINTGIDLADSFLDLTQRATNALTGAARDGLGVVKAHLPDVPFVSEPGTPGAYALQPPGRMRALPAAGGSAYGRIPTATPMPLPQVFGGEQPIVI